jgi:hypothetical protein
MLTSRILGRDSDSMARYNVWSCSMLGAVAGLLAFAEAGARQKFLVLFH